MPLVPTLDIDLSWHTHQLFPAAYYNWSEKHVGRCINHDDTVKETGLAKGLEETCQAWQTAFGEPYRDDEATKPSREDKAHTKGVRASHRLTDPFKQMLQFLRPCPKGFEAIYDPSAGTLHYVNDDDDDGAVTSVHPRTGETDWEGKELPDG